MAKLMMPPVFQYWMKGIFFNYYRSHSIYENPHFCNAEWNCSEQWFIAIQLSPKWFDFCFGYNFDGHTISYITILGIRLSKGYTWHAEQIDGDPVPTPILGDKQ